MLKNSSSTGVMKELAINRYLSKLLNHSRRQMLHIIYSGLYGIDPLYFLFRLSPNIHSKGLEHIVFRAIYHKQAKKLYWRIYILYKINISTNIF